MKRQSVNNSTDTSAMKQEKSDESTPLLSRKSEIKFPTVEDFDVVSLRAKIDSMKEEMQNLANLTNYYRRYYYAESELVIMDLERIFKEKENTHLTEKENQLKECYEDLMFISKQLKLLYAKHSTKKSVVSHILYRIDEIHRAFAVLLAFIFHGLLITLPCIILCARSVDIFLIKLGISNPFFQISNFCKTMIAILVVRCGGLEVITENLNYNDFGKECSVIQFSHSSTIDAFVISYAIPVRHYTLAKSDLFLIPFFAWNLLAYGGIPIDRNNREQAVQAIAMAGESAVCGDTVCVSPEGTRSTTGQILAFKKGPFYLWEQLKTPIIPLMIYGAYDLLPPGNLMTIPGKVYARFLPPTYPHEANTRDEMAYIVRKKMLLAWRDGPKDAGEPLSWKSRLITECYCFGTFYFTYLFFKLIPISEILLHYHLNYLQGIGLFFFFCIAITFLFYLYLMYFKPLSKKILGGGGSSSGTVSGKNAAGSVNIVDGSSKKRSDSLGSGKNGESKSGDEDNGSSSSQGNSWKVKE